MSDDDKCIELWCCATEELVSKFVFFSPMVQLLCVHVVGVQAVALRKKKENRNTVLLLNNSSSSLAANNKMTMNYH
jgi:hypothetical protein